MSELGECPHLGRPLVHPSECTICSGAAKRLADEQANVERPIIFRARYDGQCRACNLPIVAGQRVAWIKGGSPVHEDCYG